MISVLLPVYNTNPIYLHACVDSILNQSYSEFEIIIVNNGSTNQETLDVLSTFSNYKKINIVDCERLDGRKNLSVALNRGLFYCQYDYVARMDSDDLMHTERLSKQIEYLLLNSHVSILGTQLEEINPPYGISKHPCIIPQDHYLRSTHFINHPTVMFIKEHILTLGGYQEYPDHIPEDFVLWTKALKSGLKIHNLYQALVYYRNRDDNLSLQDSRHREWYQAIEDAINK